MSERLLQMYNAFLSDRLLSKCVVMELRYAGRVCLDQGKIIEKICKIVI